LREEVRLGRSPSPKDATARPGPSKRTEPPRHTPAAASSWTHDDRLRVLAIEVDSVLAGARRRLGALPEVLTVPPTVDAVLPLEVIDAHRLQISGERGVSFASVEATEGCGDLAHLAPVSRSLVRQRRPPEYMGLTESQSKDDRSDSLQSLPSGLDWFTEFIPGRGWARGIDAMLASPTAYWLRAPERARR
jgi:hypothetical protein